MDPHGTAPSTPSVDDVLRGARELAPVLRDRAKATTSARTVPRETIRDFWDIGLFSMLRPTRVGGFGVRFDRAPPVVRELARGDGSAAWVGSVLASHDLLVGFFSKEGQDDVWGSGRSLTASSLAPVGKAVPTQNGVELSGKWSFCSGIDHCDWIVVGATCEADGGASAPDVRYCLVRTALGTIVDDWHVLGLSGTGSKTFVVDKLALSQSHVVTGEEMLEGNAPGRRVDDDPLYGAPMWAVLPFFVAAPAVGIARGGLDEFIGTARARAGAPAAGRAALPPIPVQLRAAEASALLDAAELLYTRSVTETAAAVAAGTRLTVEHRVRSRRDQAFSVHLAQQALRVLLDGSGGQVIYEHNPLQRAFRDVQAAAAHVALNWDNAAMTYGRVAFGGSPSGLLY